MVRSISPAPLLKYYYAATAIFLLLDYLLDINVRIAFLEPWPAWRAIYYLFCFGCLGAIIARPSLTTLVTTAESLITLVALILGMGIRVVTLTETVLEGGGSIVTGEEIMNFIIAGAAAWIGWFRGTQALSRELHR